MNIENENTLRTHLKRGVNFFTGAGFSIQANDRNGQTLPLGSQLASELCSHFKAGHLRSLSLPRLSDVLKRQNRDEFFRFLQSRFTVSTFDPAYENLKKAAIKSIITTNIDNLPHRLFERDTDRHLNDLVVGGPSFRDHSAIDFIPLHGNITHETPDYEFGSTELASAFGRDPDRFHFLTERLQTFPTVFWGFNLEDAGPLQALHPETIAGRETRPRWIVLREPNQAEMEYFHALGFFIILADTGSFLSYLGTLTSEKSSQKSSALADILPNDRIPVIKESPPRPIADFYRGAPPIWHDVLTGRLPKTHYFSETLEDIHAGRHVIITGIPFCGKTTLLMQLAAEVNGQKICLFSDSMPEEKADLLVNSIGSDNRVCIFIDDGGASLKGVSRLLRNSGIQIVLSDRSYQLEIGSHLIDKGKFLIRDISDLTDDDHRLIYDNLPDSIRVNKIRVPQVSQGRTASVFEFVSTNVRESKLSDEFMRALPSLEQKDREMHDLFVLSCYLHACRTPVSTDVIWAFLRSKGVEHIYEKVRSLGALLAEIVSVSQYEIEDNQDYFEARSTIVAQVVTDKITRSAFHRVFDHFHKNVSPIRIPRYSVFKRSGYDAKFALRAYDNWEDGRDFYERAFTIDENYFLLQQLALYLNNKTRYQEAFVAIDRALNMSKGRVFSIRNSHAIILFDANFGFANVDSKVRDRLLRAMDILEECYRADGRKAYHAFVYAEQAIRFDRVYGDAEAKDRLLIAKSWVIEELSNPLVAKEARRLSARVSQQL